jgi:hypothetical protein
MRRLAGAHMCAPMPGRMRPGTTRRMRRVAPSRMREGEQRRSDAQEAALKRSETFSQFTTFHQASM